MTPFPAEAEQAFMSAVETITAEEILPRFRRLDPDEIAAKSRPDDLVTIADTRSEARLEEVIAAILPDAVTLGEEAESKGRIPITAAAEHPLVVIVDPVDGTWNFANGIACFGVIVAVAHEGQTLWGGIYDPMGDDWVTARRGAGAWFRAKARAPVQLSARGGPTSFGAAHGFAPTFLFDGAARQGIIDTLAHVRRLNNVGCSAHEYRTVAQGSVDFILTARLNPWDHAAGALIVEEAGGIARLLDGRAYAPTVTEGHLLTARNEALWAAAAERYAFLI